MQEKKAIGLFQRSYWISLRDVFDGKEEGHWALLKDVYLDTFEDLDQSQ